MVKRPHGKTLLLLTHEGSSLAEGLCPQDGEERYQLEAVNSLKDLLISLHMNKGNVRALIVEDNGIEGMLHEAVDAVRTMYSRVRIVVTTGKNDPKKEKEMRSKGIFYYHVKSFGLEELKLAIGVVRGHRISVRPGSKKR